MPQQITTAQARIDYKLQAPHLPLAQSVDADSSCQTLDTTMAFKLRAHVPGNMRVQSQPREQKQKCDQHNTSTISMPASQ